MKNKPTCGGLPVELLYMLLLCLIALTVVILMKIVGLILVIALLTLPAAVAAMFTRGLGRMMAIASALSLGFTLTGGLIVSYNLNLPSGAVIVIIAGLGYLAALVLKKNCPRDGGGGAAPRGGRRLTSCEIMAKMGGKNTR